MIRFELKQGVQGTYSVHSGPAVAWRLLKPSGGPQQGLR